MTNKEPIDLTVNAVTVRCPVAGCTTKVTVHVSALPEVVKLKCREHQAYLTEESSRG